MTSAFDASQTPALILVLSRDLMIASRIASEAAGLGIAHRRIESAEQAAPVLQEHRGLLLLDLDAGLDAIEEVVRLAQSMGGRAWHICGFGSHVDGEGLRRMRTAGADQVLSRSRLVQQMRELIGAHARSIG